MMFGNIGSKIKTLAVTLCVLGMIASVISAIVLWAQNDRCAPTITTGLIVLLLGCAGSWVGCLFTYAFGQLIDNSDDQVTLLRRIEKKLAWLEAEPAEQQKAGAQKPAVPARTMPQKLWKCKECGYDYNAEPNQVCAICGARR